MQRPMLFVLYLLIFSGCAGLNQTMIILDQAQSQKQAYLTNPKDRMMVTIEAAGEGLPWANCNLSKGMLSDSGTHNESFTITKPYIWIMESAELIGKLRQQLADQGYNKLSESEKASVKLKLMTSLPQLTYTCQSEGAYGLSGKIYFDGKEVSSDYNQSGYGMISLHYSMPPETVLPTK